MTTEPETSTLDLVSLGFTGLILAGAVVVGGVQVLLAPDEDPWVVRYYANEAFAGEPVATRAREITFHWGRSAPIEGIPEDGFSARFDTCLVLEEPTTVEFVLESDDGSRLYVDGEEVVDNWGPHGMQERKATRTVEAGRHHLRVDYYDVRFDGALVFTAAVGDDDARQLPVDLLVAPVDPDAEAPCEQVEGE